jgi:hypothetical protein
MLHVFYIQNHITAISMESVIAYKNIPIESVVVICFEKYYDAFVPINRRGFVVYKMNLSEIEINRKGSLGNFINEWKRHKYAKSIVKNNSFILYTPIDNRDLLRHLIFLDQCVEYNLIEEGLATYFDFSFMNYQKKRKNWKHYFLPKASQFISQFPVNKYDKFKRGYTFSEFGFSYLKNNEVIPMIVKPIIIKNFDETIPVFIFDGLVDNGQCTMEFLTQFFLDCLLKISITKLYVKFHTRQSKDEKQYILEGMKKAKIDFHLLPDSTIMEELIVSYKLKMYGFFSSLLFYNRVLAKGSTYSLGGAMIKRMDAKSQEKIAKSIFGDRVQELFINETVVFIEVGE